MRVEKKKEFLLVFIYTLCILIITILSRETNLIHEIKWIPFWSIKEWMAGSESIGLSFIMNILLFLPMGYLLMNMLIKRIMDEKKSFLATVIICGAFSLGIEITQYITYHGFCDVDDLISNIIGGIFGAVGCIIAERFSNKLKQRLPFALVIVGIIYCSILVFQNINSEPDYYMQQFAFDITRIEKNKDEITLNGYCYVYDQKTPEYQVILNDTKTGEMISTDSLITGNGFCSRVKVDLSREYEVYVNFKHRKIISTKVFIADGIVHYVKGFPPALSVPGMDDVIKNGALKAYNEDYNAYVFQYDDRIYWLIGKEIPSNTEVIYHISTNEKKKLPKDRQQYGFDNRGFLSSVVDGRQCGNYRVFEAEIPTEYNITEIGIGFNIAGRITWRDRFRIMRNRYPSMEIKHTEE